MKAVMYHYVRPDRPSLPNFKHLHIDDFRSQLDYFDREFGFVSRDGFVDFMRGGRLPSGVVLTFDDGFSDHYEHAFPELKQRGLWGIFYVPTGPYAIGRLLDVHRIHMLLGGHRAESVRSALHELVTDGMVAPEKVAEFKDFTYRTQHNDEHSLAVKQTLNYFLLAEHREAVLDELMRQLAPDVTAERFYATPSQLKQMHDEGMWIGSHTVSHPVLSALSKEEQQREIAESFAWLEQLTGRSGYRTFCYPYGGPKSFTADTESILDRAECLCSFAVEQRDIEPRDQQRRQALPRFDCNQFPHGRCR